MTTKIRDLLRPVKHAIWPSVAVLKRFLILTVLRLRYFVKGLPELRMQKRLGRPDPGHYHHLFAAGVATSFAHTRMRWWNIAHYQTSVVVILNGNHLTADAAAWVDRARRAFGSAVMIHSGDESLAGELAYPATVVTGPIEKFQRELLRLFPSHDVVLIDAREPLPEISELVSLKYAAYRYPDAGRIGVVSPSRRNAAGTFRSGVDYDRTRRSWVPDEAEEVRDYGQSQIPHYVLVDQAHGLYIKSSFVAHVAVPEHHAQTWNELCALWITAGWKLGYRTLLYAPATVQTELVLPSSELAENWLNERAVRGADGRIRVVFVLPATSISGGIRAVLEMSDGLSKRDLDIEIWALQGQPTWTEIGLKVVQFSGYAALLDALSAERAIKVATWWETGQSVWLSCVNNGIPFQYIQEFETWFYPDDEVAQAAVVSSYRREFVYTTIAEFQQQELAEIGLTAELIPSAFDDRVFRVRPEVERRADTVLALGRSFFQKNFALTLAAWKSLGEARPRLALFGIEPTIASDPRIDYSYRPDDESVAVLYSEATCFVQTSIHEGFCLPLIEAMASGCPVITTDSHGNAFCVDGVNCLMVEQGDERGVADAIQRMMGDGALRDRLRAAALMTAQDYAWPKVLSQTKTFYEQTAAAFAPQTAGATRDRP